jgi:hypothetical protein
MKIKEITRDAGPYQAAKWYQMGLMIVGVEKMENDTLQHISISRVNNRKEKKRIPPTDLDVIKVRKVLRAMNAQENNGQSTDGGLTRHLWSEI